MFMFKPKAEILFDSKSSIINQNLPITEGTGVLGIYGQGRLRKIVIESKRDETLPGVLGESQPESNRLLYVYVLTFPTDPHTSDDTVTWKVLRRHSFDEHDFPALSLQFQKWREDADSVLECQVNYKELYIFETMMDKKVNRDLPYENQDEEIQVALEQIGKSIEWKKYAGWCSFL